MKPAEEIEIKDYTCEAHTPAIAAIDLGTNSCRILIARVNIAALQMMYFRSRPRQESWRIIDSMAKIVRLGEGIHDCDELSINAIDRALEALEVCKQKIDLHNVRYVRAVATEACRRATNTQILIDRARKELNLDINIISPSEEARLAITGCAAVLNPKIPYALVFDIGGGSTEIAWISVGGRSQPRRPGYPVPFSVIASISLPCGVVTSSEQYGDKSFTIEACNEICDAVKEGLNGFFECNDIDYYIQKGLVQLLGSSGTVTTVAAMALDLQRYERTAVDGASFLVSDLDQVTQKILNMTDAQRFEHPCIGGGRTELVVIGSAILRGIYDRTKLDTMRVADRGVREGILVDLMSEVLRSNV
ncbi:MAG TPA: exopolyphosphatase [Holosporales bacterium]|nr:exopolyphosphatase [Holosporales bacterium]